MHYHVPHNNFLIIQRANKLFPDLHFPLFHVVLVAFKYILTFFLFSIQVYQALVAQLGFLLAWKHGMGTEIPVSFLRAARF